MTTFSDSTCKTLATVPKDNLGHPLVVNTQRELCGAFINNLNVTFVNYTQKAQSRRLHSLRSSKREKDFNFELFDLKTDGQKSRRVFRWGKTNFEKVF